MQHTLQIVHKPILHKCDQDIQTSLPNVRKYIM